MSFRNHKLVEYCALPYLFAELSISGTNYRFKQTVARRAVTCVFGAAVMLSGVSPILALFFNINALDLTKWISLLELLLEWGCAILVFFVFFRHRVQTTCYFNKTISISETIVFGYESHTYLSRIANRWLIKLSVIVIFHLLLTFTITDAIPDQWLTEPLLSWSYRISLFWSSYILSTFVRSLELLMLFVCHFTHELFRRFNNEIIKTNLNCNYYNVVRLSQSDAEFNCLVVGQINRLNTIISTVLVYYFFGTVSDVRIIKFLGSDSIAKNEVWILNTFHWQSYELFVGLMEMYNAIRLDHVLNNAVVFRSSLKLILRYIDFHSLIYGFNKFHQRVKCIE